jgi:hypothetical protein
MFVSGDLNRTGMPLGRNDDTIVTVETDGAAPVQLFSRSVAMPGDTPASSGWTSFSRSIALGSSHVLTLRVRNAVDGLASSFLLVDNVRLCYAASTSPTPTSSRTPSPCAPRQGPSDRTGPAPVGRSVGQPVGRSAGRSVVRSAARPVGPSRPAQVGQRSDEPGGNGDDRRLDRRPQRAVVVAARVKGVHPFSIPEFSNIAFRRI